MTDILGSVPELEGRETRRVEKLGRSRKLIFTPLSDFCEYSPKRDVTKCGGSTTSASNISFTTGNIGILRYRNEFFKRGNCPTVI